MLKCVNISEHITTRCLLVTALHNQPEIYVVSFRQGSVNVAYVARFSPSTPINIDDISRTFRNEVEHGTAFSNFTVDPASTTFQGKYQITCQIHQCLSHSQYYSSCML